MSNLGDTSFLDGIGGPGWVVEQIGDGAHDGRIVGSDGKTVSGTGTVNSVGAAPDRGTAHARTNYLPSFPEICLLLIPFS